jgi:hypothetical protein
LEEPKYTATSRFKSLFLLAKRCELTVVERGGIDLISPEMGKIPRNHHFSTRNRTVRVALSGVKDIRAKNQAEQGLALVC